MAGVNFAHRARLGPSASTCEGNPHAAVTSQLRLPSRTLSQLPPDQVAKAGHCCALGASATAHQG